MTLADLLSSSGLQTELAAKLGVHPVTISHWKRSPPREVMAPALAAATGQSVEIVLAAIREARAGRRDGRSLRHRAGIPIDTPEQARQVLAERGHPVPAEA